MITDKVPDSPNLVVGLDGGDTSRNRAEHRSFSQSTLNSTESDQSQVAKERFLLRYPSSRNISILEICCSMSLFSDDKYALIEIGQSQAVKGGGLKIYAGLTLMRNPLS